MEYRIVRDSLFLIEFHSPPGLRSEVMEELKESECEGIGEWLSNQSWCESSKVSRDSVSLIDFLERIDDAIIVLVIRISIETTNDLLACSNNFEWMGDACRYESSNHTTEE